MVCLLLVILDGAKRFNIRSTWNQGANGSTAIYYTLPCRDGGHRDDEAEENGQEGCWDGVHG